MDQGTRTAALGLCAAGVATMAKTKAEAILQPVAEKLAPPAPVERTAIGADVAGHPENMPPSELADRVVHLATGAQLTDEQRRSVSAPLHWAMGLGFGLGYALAGRRFRQVRAGLGVVAGAALFAGTHGSLLPAAGLQHPPWSMPTAWWVWEGGSHVVYGVVLDSSLRVLDAATS